MTRFRPLVLSFALALSTIPALAQGPPRMGGGPGPPDSVWAGAYGGGMMGAGTPMMARLHRRMMRSPMHRMQMNVLLLPALADTLGLTDDQLRRLEQLRTTLQNEQQEWRRQMQAKRQSFRRLMASDSLPSAEAVRTHMQTIASLRVEHQASTYAAAQSMRDVLTEEQRAAVDDLPPRRRVRLLMTHVPMMDMMQMMGPMGGGAGAWGPRMGMHRRMGRRGGRGPGR